MSEQHPKLREPLHKSLTAHHRTPTMLWQKSGHTANPMLALGDQHIPTVVQNLNTIDSEYFIAKIIFMKNDSSTGYANFVLPIPESVASELQIYLKTRLLLLWFRYRRHNFKICIEDILRERSDIIYRSFFELN